MLVAVGLALAISLLLMRPAFRPFDELAERMRRHDPLALGERVDVDGGPKVTALADAFNEMLDRLESDRRESTRRALMVREAERRRVARELHDEVGQTLTGVMLQVEGLAAKIPEELRDELDELRETRTQRRRGRAPDRATAASRGTRIPLGCPAPCCRHWRRHFTTRQASGRNAGCRRAWRRLMTRSWSSTASRRRRSPTSRDMPALRASSSSSSGAGGGALLTVRQKRNRAGPRRQRLLARHPRHARARDADRRAAHDRFVPRRAGTEVQLVLPLHGQPRR